MTWKIAPQFYLQSDDPKMSMKKGADELPCPSRNQTCLTSLLGPVYVVEVGH
jgi:hypothetical protein